MMNNKEKEKEMRGLFLELTNSTFIWRLQKFHKLTEEIFGFDYAERNLDEIIDAIDYSQGALTFQEFKSIMEKEAKKILKLK